MAPEQNLKTNCKRSAIRNLGLSMEKEAKALLRKTGRPCANPREKRIKEKKTERRRKFPEEGSNRNPQMRAKPATKELLHCQKVGGMREKKKSKYPEGGGGKMFSALLFGKDFRATIGKRLSSR